MADFNFLHVFGVSLVVTTLKTTLFNPMSLVKTFSSSGSKSASAVKQSPLQAMMSGMQGFSEVTKGLEQTNPEIAGLLGSL